MSAASAPLDSVLPPSGSDLERRGALLASIAALDFEEAGSPEDPVRALRTLAAAGLLRECVPRGVGGVDERVSVRALCTCRAALAYRSPLLDLMFVMQGLGSAAVSLSGSEAQRQSYLPKVASGEAIAALALTEPEAGSDLSGIRTRAERQPDGSYRIDGEKVFISNAGLATHYVLYARTSDHKKHGLSAFLLPASTPGVEVTPLRLLAEDHPIGRVALRGVRLEEAARIGQEGQGMELALAALERFRPSVGAAAVGMAKRALAESIAHVKSRSQFGQPLAQFQATQLALAEMATECEAAALLVTRAAELLDSELASQEAKSSAATAGSMAKLFATEAAQRVIDRAVQLHGGKGLLAGSLPERLYRDVRALRIYEGTSEIQKLIIARALLR